MAYYQDPDPKASAQMRQRMIDGQLRGRGIWDEKVLNAFQVVQRHEFVSEALYRRAYEDYPLPISAGQTISQPYIVAYMTQELLLQGEERVLEIGTGSGFQAAILAQLCQMVVSIERIKELYTQAWERLIVHMGYRNIRLILGNGLSNDEIKQGFDRIVVTASGPHPPVSLMRLLKPGGMMIIPIGDRESQVLYRIVHLQEGQIVDGQLWSEYPGFAFRRLLDVRFVPLIGPGGWNEN